MLVLLWCFLVCCHYCRCGWSVKDDRTRRSFLAILVLSCRESRGVERRVSGVCWLVDLSRLSVLRRNPFTLFRLGLISALESVIRQCRRVHGTTTVVGCGCCTAAETTSKATTSCPHKEESSPSSSAALLPLLPPPSSSSPLAASCPNKIVATPSFCRMVAPLML